MYQAQFYKAEGLADLDIGGPMGLNATALDDAQNEALSLNRPHEANFIKILFNGQAVGERLGFDL